MLLPNAAHGYKARLPMFDFQTMITPWVIRVFFVLDSLGCVFGGAALIGLGLRGSRNWGEVAGGAALLVFGPFVVRLICEQAILLFRMNETLTNMYALAYQAVIEHEDEREEG